MGEIESTLAPPVDGEPSSHETCGLDPAGEVAETFPGDSPDPQTQTAKARAGS